MGGKKEKIEAYDAMLRKHSDEKHIVKFCREFINFRQSNIYGYILDLSANFVLVQFVYDFTIDGYVVIPKHRFDSLNYNKCQKAATKIVSAEGSCDKLWGIDYDVDLGSWQALFSSLKELDMHVIIECEDMEKALFIIGPVTDISKSAVSVQYYHATGRQDKKSTKVKYRNITSVKFDDAYSTTFRKYIKAPKS